jgi:hypothetical protein
MLTGGIEIDRPPLVSREEELSRILNSVLTYHFGGVALVAGW